MGIDEDNDDDPGQQGLFSLFCIIPGITFARFF